MREMGQGLSGDGRICRAISFQDQPQKEMKNHSTLQLTFIPKLVGSAHILQQRARGQDETSKEALRSWRSKNHRTAPSSGMTSPPAGTFVQINYGLLFIVMIHCYFSFKTTVTSDCYSAYTSHPG